MLQNTLNSNIFYILYLCKINRSQVKLLLMSHENQLLHSFDIVQCLTLELFLKT